jgi:outer membrane protein OmpA-like peptidoglycan-associated protein
MPLREAAGWFQMASRMQKRKDMKLPCLFIVSSVSLIYAQTPPVIVIEERAVEIGSRGEVVTEETVTEVERTEIPRSELVVEEVQNPRRLDAAVARRQLGTAPRLAERSRVETETTPRETRRAPRVYHRERNVVVVEGMELPYVTIPVLFVKESDALLDDESRLAIEDTAKAIREIVDSNPNARFDIEGHTSTDGSDELNLELSAKRARRVYDELTQRYRIPEEVLSAHGYGESYPNFPNGSEEQMSLDRRVLVVRLK